MQNVEPRVTNARKLCCSLCQGNRANIAGQVEYNRELLEKGLIKEEELSGWGTDVEEFIGAKIKDFELLSIKEEKSFFYIHREALIKHSISLQSKNTGLRTILEFDPGYWPVGGQYRISFNYLYGKYYNFFYK